MKSGDYKTVGEIERIISDQVECVIWAYDMVKNQNFKLDEDFLKSSHGCFCSIVFVSHEPIYGPLWRWQRKQVHMPAC